MWSLWDGEREKKGVVGREKVRSVNVSELERREREWKKKCSV